MYYLGVDVGGTNIAVGIVDENNAIIAKASHPTPVPCSEDAFCDAILAVCNDALAKAGLTLDDVPWIGIGCPGTVNRATGIIEFANNLYFKNFKLRDMMAERTNGKLVILENDANAGSLRRISGRRTCRRRQCTGYHTWHRRRRRHYHQRQGLLRQQLCRRRESATPSSLLTVVPALAADTVAGRPMLPQRVSSKPQKST